MFDPDSSLNKFAEQLRMAEGGHAACIAHLREGVIGEGLPITGPFGVKPLIYADYIASGRALSQVEDFIGKIVLPVYANSHTQASYCGRFMTRLRAAARAWIARHCGADSRFEVIFTGAGATHGINRLVHLLGIATASQNNHSRPLILLGPYEHHSNILPWRESGAEVVEIPEGALGGPDLTELEKTLKAVSSGRLVVAAFSAASNVTGIMADVESITCILNRYGVKSVWDYAGGGPYMPINMCAGESGQIDAIVISPHKFVGGPAASGVLIIRKDAVAVSKPTFPGGGTVQFVSPWDHDYTSHLGAREESGTPNIIGDIRAALAFIVKETIGQAFQDSRNAILHHTARDAWRNHPQIELLGHDQNISQLPIFSFRVRNTRDGGYVHQQLFTRMLSDVFGIQARGGCACAGPYAHRLLNISRKSSTELRDSILKGREIVKPGWTRLNFSVLMDDAKVESIIRDVALLAADPHPYLSHYRCDESTARFEALSSV